MKKEIYLMNRIYDKERINIAIEAFKDIAKIALEIRNDYYCCTVEDSICDSQVVVYEFENYLIALMNQ